MMIGNNLENINKLNMHDAINLLLLVTHNLTVMDMHLLGFCLDSIPVETTPPTFYNNLT